MISIGSLTLFNVIVLLSPPKAFMSILELMDLPFHARTTLLFAALVNAALSLSYEHWGAQAVAQVIGSISQIHRRWRTKEGKTYKAIEGGMH